MMEKILKKAACFLLGFAIVVNILPAAVTAAGTVPINKETFPDDVFRNYVIDNFDTNKDGTLDENEIANAKTIDYSWPDETQKISDLTGIAYLTGLTELDISGNSVSSMDISNNTALTDLAVIGNGLQELDLSNCSVLSRLNVFENRLQELDLSKNTALAELYASNNLLKELDLTCNTMLTDLDAFNNQLQKINISCCSVLSALNVSDNQLQKIDVSNCTALVTLFIGGNLLQEIDVGNCTRLLNLDVTGNGLQELDLSKNTVLYTLYASDNQLEELEVSNNTDLAGLSVSNNQLEHLDLTYNTALLELFADGNQLQELDLSCNTELSSIDVSSNQLSSLDISKLKNPESCSAANNRRTVILTEGRSFDLSTLPGFDVTKASSWIGGSVSGTVLTFGSGVSEVSYTYNCGNGFTADFVLVGSTSTTAAVPINKDTFPDDIFRNYVLANFDTSTDGALDIVEIANAKAINYQNPEEDTQKISDLSGIAYLTALTSLKINGNALTGLDVSKNVSLAWIDVSDNQLQKIKLSNNPLLTHLGVCANQLQEINLSNNTALTYLDIGHNQLKEINLCNNTALLELSVESNQLKEINLSNNTALVYLYAGNNQLQELDVSKSTALSRLYAENNQLSSLDVSNVKIVVCSATGNRRTVTLTENRSFDLSTLPGFDITKASSWSGGSISGTVLTFDSGVSEVSYDYNCGNCPSVTFVLQGILPGDANLDGKVDGRDMIDLSKYITGILRNTTHPDRLLSMDVNGDSKVDSLDLVLLAKHLTSAE